MCSSLISKARICLKPLNPFFTIKTVASLSDSPKLPIAARTLCTDGTKPGRQTDRMTGGLGGIQNKATGERWRDKHVSSVFAAGTAKRTAEWLRRKAPRGHLEKQPAREEAVKSPPPERPLSTAEWRKLRESSPNPQRFDFQMMLVLLQSGAQLDIAKSLLTSVATETGTLSYKLLLQYLALCVSGGHDDEVWDVYGIMRARFPSLDPGAHSLFIKSFSRTERWREALSILHHFIKVFPLSTRHYDYVIAGALAHGDVATAWALYDDLIKEGLRPQQETWDTLFKGGAREETDDAVRSDFQQRLLSILLYMRNNQVYPQQSLAASINTWFQSLAGQTWRGSWTDVMPIGKCRGCGSELESIGLTAEEYQQLKDRVMTDIIKGRDVWNKTTPEELEIFKSFVKKKPPFDVVVDGLNIAHLTGERDRQSETLLAVVCELERLGQTVLVLGRKHMMRPSRKWNERHMVLIQKKAHCFFTDNISKDDPFLLYAALHSGNHCHIVTSDLMRDHKACLDPATSQLFFKWQRGHQLVVDGRVVPGRRVRFKTIPSYDTIVQTAGDSWHIPYDDTDRSIHEVPQRWLCLTKKH